MPTARPAVIIVVFLASSLSAMLACAQPRAPVDPRVTAEIVTVEAQITVAEAENTKYAGGLVKALIELRLATLKQTRALLAQRATAGDLNVAIRYTADGKPFTLPDGSAAALKVVEDELEGMEPKIAAAEAEAVRYSGGLVQALSLSTVATMRQSQAMLEQKRLSLKYGLPQFIGFAESNKAASVPPSTTTSGASPATLPLLKGIEYGGSAKAAEPAEPAGGKDWEIVSVDSKVTESNDTWWKYAWRLTLRNKGVAPHAFRATVEFQDKDGFIIDTSDSDTIVVPPNADDTATGFALIRPPGANNVVRTVAKVRVVR
jgi:hypothetical protein